MADQLDDLRNAIDRLPDDVTKALRAVASVTAGRVQRRAREIAGSKIKRVNAVIAVSVVDDQAHNQFLVIAEGASDKPANLALWFERGTRFMEARPFLRPAADAEVGRWREDSMRAVERVADKLAKT